MNLGKNISRDLRGPSPSFLLVSNQIYSKLSFNLAEVDTICEQIGFSILNLYYEFGVQYRS